MGQIDQTDTSTEDLAAANSVSDEDSGSIGGCPVAGNCAEVPNGGLTPII